MRGDAARLNALLARENSIDAEVKTAAIKDFKRVAAEYFETEGDFRLELSHGKRGDEVTLTFRVLRVKNFTKLR